jgi:hypothetical protein
MTLRDVITVLLLLASLAALVGFLWGIIRSIIANLRLRGWQDRLAQPRPEEVEALWGVRLPSVLEEFYRSGVAKRFEFYLAPPANDRSRRWFIAQFVPLTARDIGEWKLRSLPGIPIAIDGDRGFYYLPFAALRRGESPPVLHRGQGSGWPFWPFTDTEVAQSIEDFFRFQPVQAPDENDQDRAEQSAADVRMDVESPRRDDGR